MYIACTCLTTPGLPPSSSSETADDNHNHRLLTTAGNLLLLPFAFVLLWRTRQPQPPASSHCRQLIKSATSLIWGKIHRFSNV